VIHINDTELRTLLPSICYGIRTTFVLVDSEVTVLYLFFFTTKHILKLKYLKSIISGGICTESYLQN
jgi:hypothetical protein